MNLMHILLAVAAFEVEEGVVVIHGALAALDSRGVILAGKSDAGKSTASRRIPPPWESLCSDLTLVVPDGEGRFFAHPLPTWGRILTGDAPARWPVERAIPLAAICFLEQSPLESLDAVGIGKGLCLLNEVAEQAAWPIHQHMEKEDQRRFRARLFDNLAALARAVPAYRLRLSLTGEFWKEIEKVLPGKEDAGGVKSHGKELRLHLGRSMEPALRDGDLLEIHRPHFSSLERGDVVVLRPAPEQSAVVHRIVSLSSESLRTRGDNNDSDDPWLARPEEVIGRVTSARRGGRRIPVAGGGKGRIISLRRRFLKSTERVLAPAVGPLWRLALRLNPIPILLPRSLRPRIVVFRSEEEYVKRLFIGRREAGRYDEDTNQWIIPRQWRLLVRMNKDTCQDVRKGV